MICVQFSSDLQDIVEKISEVEVDDHGFPIQPIRIIDCGIKPVSSPYHLPHPDEESKDGNKDKKKWNQDFRIILK